MAAVDDVRVALRRSQPPALLAGYVARGLSVGVFDVPFMPRIGVTKGFEISEWGPHDVLDGETLAGPPAVAWHVAAVPRHPLSVERLDAAGAADRGALSHLGSALLDGIRRRGAMAADLIATTAPDVAIVTFTEIHHAAHHLWHLVEPAHPVYRNDGYRDAAPIAPDVASLFRELDSQIAAIVSRTHPAGVIVFALHGMRPAHGIPSFLPGLLGEWGVSAEPTWRTRTWRERTLATLGAIKRRMPPAAKRLYYRSVSQRTAQRLARPTMLPAYEESDPRVCDADRPARMDPPQPARTRGTGDRRRGGVRGDSGGAHHQDRRAANRAGSTVAAKVFRTAGTADEALTLRLPDIVVHWTDEVFGGRAVAGSAVPMRLAGTKFSGQHAMLGFCVASGAAAVPARQVADADGVLAARDLHRVISAAQWTPGAHG